MYHSVAGVNQVVAINGSIGGENKGLGREQIYEET